MGDIAHYQLYPEKAELILGSGKFIWNMHRFKKIRSLNRLSKKDLWENLLKESFKDEISPFDPSLFLHQSSYQVKNILSSSVFRSACVSVSL